MTTINISEKMWGKKAIHIPNITDLFGIERVGGFADNYQTRVLCLLAKRHKLILPERHRQSSLELIKHFNDLGFDHFNADQLIFLNDNGNKTEIAALTLALSENIPELTSTDYRTLVPFVTTHNTNLLATKFNKKLRMNYSMSTLLNDKAHLRELLIEKGIRVPGAYRVSIYGDDYIQKSIAIYEMLKSQGIKEFAVVIPQACSGFGILRFKNKSQLLKLISKPDFTEFLIDPWYSDNIGSPSFQVFIRCETWRAEREVE
ncbi:MAG: hypothetical protein ACO2ZM_03360 [Francisellaceae bacterium]